MYLLEHDAKELLASRGVVVPAGCLIESPDALAAAQLPPAPWVVKGQIGAGGRGKAGIIRKAATRAELESHLAAILGATIGNRRINAVRVEQDMGAAREAYVAFLLDPANGGVRVVLSARGGVDIEQLPRETILSEVALPEVDPLTDCVRRLARDLPPRIAPALLDAGAVLARAYVEHEALLLEVNPLFVRDDGSWAAGDVKMVIDDGALPRQPALRALIERRARAYREIALKSKHGFDYVVVDDDGEIGLLTTGAGLSMMLIDELHAAGLKPYNFLDIRTGELRGDTRRLTQALEWIGQGRKVRVLFVNIFAGITDLGEFARLLVAALAEVPRFKAPVVARLVGNGLPAAREALAAAGIALLTDLDAALAAVRGHLGK